MKNDNLLEQIAVIVFATWLTASCTVGSLVILRWLILISMRYGF